MISGPTLPTLTTAGSWPSALEGDGRAALEQALPGWLRGRRWFGGKARPIAAVRIVDAARLGPDDGAIRMALLEVKYAGAEPEVYALPLAFAAGDAAGRVRAEHPASAIARLGAGGEDGLLHAADDDPALARALVDVIVGGRSFQGARGAIVSSAAAAIGPWAAAVRSAAPAPLGAEQSNTSFRLGREAVLKLFRRLASGPNPDVEVGAFLTDVACFPHTPPLRGAVEYRVPGREPLALAILQGFVPNEGDAWAFTVARVARLLASVGEQAAPAGPRLPLARAGREAPPPELLHAAGDSLDAAALLGRRTAELHVALSSHPEVEAFRPEPLSDADVRHLQEGVRAQAATSLETLRTRRDALAPEVRARADRVLAAAPALERALGAVLAPPPRSLRTRTHGDYHLGQVLWTGGDFVIIDFEGEPARPLADRRAKVPPIRDVAGMIRSYHYAAYHALAAAGPDGAPRGPGAEPWARSWYAWAAATYLGAYEETWRAGTPRPDDTAGRHRLLALFLAEKAFYELAYELNHRPDWAWLPLQGLQDLASEAATMAAD